MFRETKHAALNQREELEKMARRRFQNPTPFREGGFWWIIFYQDHFSNGVRTRKRTRKKLAPATTLEREAKKIAAEFLRPQNQGLVTLGSATPFTHYVESVYIPTVLPLMAKSTQERYAGVIKNYLVPAFGSACLRDLTPLSVQQYFSAQRNSKLAHASLDKIRDVLSSIMGSAKTYGMLVTNPVEGVRLPPAKRGKRRKPFLTPAQFTSLLPLLPEPYATMVFVATYTGLRVSELIGLRWKNVHADTITVEERYCRGDWGQPKSQASNATIAVNGVVIERGAIWQRAIRSRPRCREVPFWEVKDPKIGSVGKDATVQLRVACRKRDKRRQCGRRAVRLRGFDKGSIRVPSRANEGRI